MPRSVSEILESAKRFDSVLSGSARRDLEGLHEEWTGIGVAGLPFIDFVPIRLVSLIERHVRHFVSELTDYGEPFSSRAVEVLGKGLSSKKHLRCVRSYSI